MSVPFRADEAARWCDARILRGARARVLAAVKTDSRAPCKDALFVAIVGPAHDAHAHLAQALAQGAQALLISRADAVAQLAAPADLPVLLASDTTRALGALAAGHRANFSGPVIAITGSNGKTTTKDLCAAMLSARMPTLCTRDNRNNIYGAALTLLARETQHRALVVELGMNQRGEIATLAKMTKPTVAVITNLGAAHLAGLGTRESIAQEKGDLIAALGATDTALLNADDALLMTQAARTRARVLRFGLGASARDAEFRASALRETETGHAFLLHTPDGDAALEVDGAGAHNIANALAAAGAALCAGATLEDVARGAKNFRAPAGRMTLRKLAGGVTLLDDSYNANPQSLEAALRTLAARAAIRSTTTRRFVARAAKNANASVAVLGDMGELGEQSAREHEAAGALAAKLHLSALITLGEFAERTRRAAIVHGFDAERALVARSHEDAARIAREHCTRGAWLLVKGSRAMHMERVVTALTNSEGER